MARFGNTCWGHRTELPSDVVEIHGIPMERNEDILNVVRGVGRALYMNIAETMIQW